MPKLTKIGIVLVCFTLAFQAKASQERTYCKVKSITYEMPTGQRNFIRAEITCGTETLGFSSNGSATDQNLVSILLTAKATNAPIAFTARDLYWENNQNHILSFEKITLF